MTQQIDLDALAGHTPEPWRFDGRIGCCAVYTGPVRTCLSGGDFIALYGYDRADDGRGWKAEPEKEANARLIAAAPALLAELRAAREELAAREQALESANGVVRHLYAQIERNNEAGREEIARLRAALVSVEWEGGRYICGDFMSACPLCGVLYIDRKDGHKPDCLIGHALAVQPAPKAPEGER